MAGSLDEGESLYYRVDVPAGETLVVTFDSDSADAFNELYIRFGEFPTRADFDFASIDPFEPDQRVVVPITQSGTYYILAFGNDAPAAESFNITAETVEFTVIDTDFGVGGNAGNLTIEINGAKFERDMIFRMERSNSGGPSETVLMERLLFVDSSRVFVTFDLRSHSLGTYDIVAILPDSSVATLNESFEIVEGEGGTLLTDIVSPSAVQPQAVVPMSLLYANSGLNDLPSPLMLLSSLSGAPISLTREGLRQGRTQLDLFLRPNEGPVDVLRPGATGEIGLFVQTGISNQMSFSVSAYNDGHAAIDWVSFISAVQDEGTLDTNEIDPYFTFARDHLGETVGELSDAVNGIMQLWMERQLLAFEGEAERLVDFEIDLDINDPVQAVLFAAGHIAADPSLEVSGLARNSISRVLTKTISGEPEEYLHAASRQNDDVNGNVSRTTSNDVPVNFNVWGEDSRDGNGTINPNNPTIIITHGFLNTGGNADNNFVPTQWMQDIANGFRSQPGGEDINIIVVDWEEGSGIFDNNPIPYAGAASNTWFLGDEIAGYLNDLGVDASQTTLIGHSLGAQASGEAGKEYEKLTGDKIDTIIALDPAGPMFEMFNNGFFRLDPSDADKVIAIHTSDIYGYDDPVGDADLYLNPVRDEAHWFGDGLTYDHPGIGSLNGVGAHGFAHQFLIQLLMGKQFIDPNTNRALDLEGLNNLEGSLDFSTHDDSSDLLGGLMSLLDLVSDREQVLQWVMDVVFSRDPNDILGPQGFGDSRWMSTDEALNYTIRFENDPEFATAPAQVVSITQQLDSELDFRTFRLGDFALGEFIVDVPDNRAFFQDRLDFGETFGIFVDVVAGINVATGEAFWEFRSIDPLTGEIPLDPFLGLLPINTTSPEGEGFAQYSVRPKSTASTGDVVDAQARIIFDVNEPIDTPPIFNTLDAAAPSSQVDALPGQVGDTTFQVAWSGQDDAEGSAIADFSVFVSVDGGPFEVWLENTTLTQAPYVGEEGKAYTFYSIARDNAGNVEAAPAAADASTRVGDAPPVVTEVFVRGASWSQSYLDGLAVILEGDAQHGYALLAGPGQLDPLPWGNLDQVSIRFSEDVEVQIADMTLAGAEISDYVFLADDPTDASPASQDGFRYDPATFTATWTLAAPIPSPDLLALSLNGADDATGVIGVATGLALDGDTGDPADAQLPSGDGVTGGDFVFRFDVLPGDADGSGGVEATDLNTLAVNWQQTVAGRGGADFDGDDIVDAVDLNILAVHWQRDLATLPLDLSDLSLAAVMAIDRPSSGRARTDIRLGGGSETRVVLDPERVDREVPHFLPRRLKPIRPWA